ncbi:CYTH domain-containing protein [Desulfitobacterium sp. AusDCA]|uniref:CYTH domain-containing protein n=1 Tax=Desulfitobacterium sp. AusDCA TaxID=3240383 RepID=UPI003DA77E86
MAIEIEHKYLVYQELLPRLGEGQKIIQGYLAVKPSIRFRILGQEVMITVKNLHSDGSRFEFETSKSNVSIDEQEELLRLALFPVIEKIRYRVPFSGLVWEIDVYQRENLGLITADVELPSLDHPIDFPEWINSQQEITHDARYFNWNLGQKAFTKWEDS